MVIRNDSESGDQSVPVHYLSDLCPGDDMDMIHRSGAPTLLFRPSSAQWTSPFRGLERPEMPGSEVVFDRFRAPHVATAFIVLSSTWNNVAFGTRPETKQASAYLLTL